MATQSFHATSLSSILVSRFSNPFIVDSFITSCQLLSDNHWYGLSADAFKIMLPCKSDSLELIAERVEIVRTWI